MRFVVAVLLFSSSLSLQASDATHEWLMKISQAARKLNYQGTFVYQHGSHLEAMEIIHQVKDGVVKERLVSLNGAPREVIRDNHEVRCYLPDENSVVVEYRQLNEKNFPAILPENLHLLADNYQIRLGRSGRISDHDVQLVEISPLDEFRYGYQLWAAKESGLVLEAALVNRTGESVERFMFTRIQIGGEIDPAALKPRSEGKDMVWHRDTRPEAGPEASAKPAWKVVQLPKGFSLSAYMSRTHPIRKVPMEQLVFSDGLAAVSVFIEKSQTDSGDADAQGSGYGLNQMGAVHAYSTLLDGYRVTAVGEVPAQTVSRIAGSLMAQP